MIDGNAHSQADVLVNSDAKAELKAADFKRVAADPTGARGIAVNPATVYGGITAGPKKVVDTNLAGFPISFGMTLIPDFSQGIYFSQEDEKVSFNILWGGAHDIRGVQFSPLLNADSGELRGFQFAGLANIVKGRAEGAQLAPVANVALGGFGGAQILSLVNIAGGEARGAQIGLVNVASHITGTQVGLVNVSDRIDGLPVGLVNIETGGVLSPQLWAEAASWLRFGFAFGTRTVYTIAALGFGFGTSPESPSASLGVGARLTLGRFFGDLDFSWSELFGDAGRLDFSRPQSRLEARALAGFPAKGPGIILGCALEFYMPGLSRENDGAAVTDFRVEPRLLFGAKL
jgi:hypothetical protein